MGWRRARARPDRSCRRARRRSECSRKRQGLGPNDEWFDGIIKMVVVWGAAWVIEEKAAQLRSNVLTVGWSGGIGLLVIFSFAATIFCGGERWPSLRDGF